MDHRLKIPSDIDPQWASMIESCWDRYILPPSQNIRRYYLSIYCTSNKLIPANPSSFSLNSDPQRRPSFQELLERLRELQKKYALQVQMQRSTAGKGAEKMSVDDG